MEAQVFQQLPTACPAVLASDAWCDTRNTMVEDVPWLKTRAAHLFTESRSSAACQEASVMEVQDVKEA